jgi:hypothetical protein
MTTAAPQTSMRVQKNALGCITIPFLLIAMIPLAWGARNQWANGTLMRTGEVVPGRVTELRYVPSNSSTRGGRGSANSPVVAYTTRAGEVRSMVGSVNRYPAPWAVGDTVDVVYFPANPDRVDLVSEVSGWVFWFVIWCAVALVPLAIAILPVVLKLREGRA